ncbi:hypothetical protein Q1W73_16460 [Asticcacaulis sp. ZE23SCel15]|uniref:hypothetical protein n=1 Tax=Asticcacaulis sp. ZE23SCel15 TaxID=3059027 RepID=UPI00265E233B|nr:hypothetical protein [Asticcacaulis sp. ZE23SCel15]WKL57236.1 hypothetical protein Q1W73_16460 [Asticcacaulis sp. ZE23SCel15]
MARTENEILLFQMDANIRALSKKLDTARKDTDKTSRDIQKRLDSVSDTISADLMGSINSAAAQVPVLGSALSGLGGVAGGVAAVGLSALAVGLHQAREAMLWSAEVTDLSEKLGITAEALQALEFAADESGVPIEELHGALGNLNASLGAIKTGVGDAKIKKVFEALGLTKADVAGVETSAEFIPLLADRISKLGSVAEQVKLAKTLGIEALVPLLARGSEGVHALTQEASRLGLVIDNQTVKALDEMNRKVEISQQRIDVGLKRAFLGLAPAIEGSTNALADFVQLLTAAEDPGMAKRLRGLRAKNGISTMGDRWSDFAEGVSASDMSRGRRGSPAEIRARAAQIKQAKEMAALLADIESPKSGRSGGSGKSVAYTGPLAAGADDRNWELSEAGYKVADSFIKAKSAYDEFGSAIVEFTPGLEITDKYAGLKLAVEDLGQSLVYAAAYGDDLGDALSGTFRRIAAEWAANKLSTLLAGLFDGKEGGGFKIPGFAAGTMSAPGGLALVGERGAELVNLNRGARVYTASETQSILNGANQSRGGSFTYAPVIDLKGAVMTEDLVAGLRREMVAGQRKTLAMADSQNRRTFAGRSASLSKLGTV